jgi:hypothetical protein
VRRGEALLGHPYILVGGRRKWLGRAGGDGNWRPINGAVTGVKEGEEMWPSSGGERGAHLGERGEAAGMAWRRAKGGRVLDPRREDERGAGPVGQLACWADSRKVGQMANGLMKKKKENIIRI